MTRQRVAKPVSGVLALVFALCIASGYLITGGTAVFRELEAHSLAWRMELRGPRLPPPSLAILAIDDRTVQSVGRWPLPRAMLADSLTAVREAGAEAVGLDILLVDRESPSNGVYLSVGDRKLLEALRQQPETVLAMALLFQAMAAPDRLPAADVARIGYSLVLTPPSGALQAPLADGAILPMDAFLPYSQPGHVNVLFGVSGDALSLFPAVQLDNTMVPSFSVKLAAERLSVPTERLGIALDGHLLLGERRVALDIDLSLPLNYYGPEGTIPTYRLADLLAGRLSADVFAGKAVLIGATALGVGERFNTPLDDNLPGVELLATGAANLLDGSHLIRTPETRFADAGLVVVLTLAAWALGRFLGIRLAVPLLVLLLCGWAGVTYLAMVELRWWLALAVPSFAMIGGGGLGMVGRAGEERRRRRELERQRHNLSRYVPPLMAERLAASERPDFDRRDQQAAILFVDLEGFTGDSEARTPAETVEFLVDYHRRLERAVMAHKGVIEQFQGDGAMVIFGLPEPQPDDAPRALACTRAVLQALHEWRPDLRMRAGLHYGAVTIAQLGGQSQAQLAAAGDTVNVASRLETLAKERSVAVVISEELALQVEACGQGALLSGFQRVEPVALRGRRHEMGLRVARRTALLDDQAGTQPVK